MCYGLHEPLMSAIQCTSRCQRGPDPESIVAQDDLEFAGTRAQSKRERLPFVLMP